MPWKEIKYNKVVANMVAAWSDINEVVTYRAFETLRSTIPACAIFAHRTSMAPDVTVISRFWYDFWNDYKMSKCVARNILRLDLPEAIPCTSCKAICLRALA